MKTTKDIIDALKERGVKVTPQRIAIIKFLQNDRSHSTAEQIYEALLDEYPTMSLATVYNTLELLNDMGKIERIKIADENIVNYDYKRDNHYHFYCKGCKKIYDIDLPFDSDIAMNREDFIIDEVVLYFRGYCKVCQTSGKGKKI